MELVKGHQELFNGQLFDIWRNEQHEVFISYKSYTLKRVRIVGKCWILFYIDWVRKPDKT